MNDARPLSALLAQLLVAFTIEFDNEFERAAPHRITTGSPSNRLKPGPWLVSMVMWLQLLRFVPDEGIGVEELYRLTDLPPKAFRMWLTRLSKWWRYLNVSDMFVRPTPGGRKALEVWRPLIDQIQHRCGSASAKILPISSTSWSPSAAKSAPVIRITCRCSGMNC